MELIVISGVDGSGKSTQLNLLKNHLAANGSKVYAFHAIQFSVANRIANIIQPSRKRDPDKPRAVTKASWFAVQVRKIALLIDIFFFRMLVKMLTREKYDYIISDRYFYDTVINIIFLSKIHFSLLTPIIERMIPVPDLRIFLAVEPEVIMQRAAIPEQGHDYVARKTELYNQKFEQWEYLKLDGNQTPEAIFAQIKEAVTL